jgi:hypothetical protein
MQYDTMKLSMFNEYILKGTISNDNSYYSSMKVEKVIILSILLKELKPKEHFTKSILS